MGEKKVFKATAWYLLSNILIKGISFFTTPVFSRILTTEEYGTIFNFDAWYAIILIVASLSLSSSLVRARFDYQDQLNGFIKTNLLFGTAFTIAIYLIFSINLDFWANIFVFGKKYIFLMFISIAVSPAYDMFLQIERFEYRYKTVTVLTVVLALSNILLSFLLIWLMEDNLTARLLGTQIPTIIIGIILYVRFLLSGGEIKSGYIRFSLPMCLPYVVHLLSGSLLSSSDRTMITKICGATETALYGMACNVALIVNVLLASMNNAFSPWMGEKLNEKQYDAIKKYSYGYILIFVFVAFGLVLIAPEALLFLGGGKYLSAKTAIPPVVFGFVFVFLYSLYVNIEQFEKKTGWMAIGTCSSAVLNIVLNIVFIPRYGYIAAAYTTLFSFFALFVFHFVVVKKMGLHICYDTKFILCISFVCLLFCLLISALYDSPVRYLLLAVYAIVMLALAYCNRERFRKIIKEMRLPK